MSAARQIAAAGLAFSSAIAAAYPPAPFDTDAAIERRVNEFLAGNITADELGAWIDHYERQR